MRGFVETYAPVPLRGENNNLKKCYSPSGDRGKLINKLI
jgi:hypothetical protein